MKWTMWNDVVNLHTLIITLVVLSVISLANGSTHVEKIPSDKQRSMSQKKACDSFYQTSTINMGVLDTTTCQHLMNRNFCEDLRSMDCHEYYQIGTSKTKFNRILNLRKSYGNRKHDIISCALSKLAQPYTFEAKIKTIDDDAHLFNHVIPDVKPFTSYIIQAVDVTPSEFWTASKMKCFETLPEAPGKPENLTVEVKYGLEINSSCCSLARLSWKLPEEINGKPIRFLINLYYNNNGYTEVLKFNKSVEHPYQAEFNHAIGYLQHGYSFVVSIQLEVENVSTPGEPATITFSTLPGYCVLDYKCCQYLKSSNHCEGKTVIMGSETTIGSVFGMTTSRPYQIYEIRKCPLGRNQYTSFHIPTNNGPPLSTPLWDMLEVTERPATYILQVGETNSDKNGWHSALKCIMLPRVRQDLVVVVTTPEGTTRSSATLSWKLPDTLNRKPVNFTGSFSAESNPSTISDSVEVKPLAESNHTFIPGNYDQLDHKECKNLNITIFCADKPSTVQRVATIWSVFSMPPSQFDQKYEIRSCTSGKATNENIFSSIGINQNTQFKSLWSTSKHTHPSVTLVLQVVEQLETETKRWRSEQKCVTLVEEGDYSGGFPVKYPVTITSERSNTEPGNEPVSDDCKLLNHAYCKKLTANDYCGGKKHTIGRWTTVESIFNITSSQNDHNYEIRSCMLGRTTSKNATLSKAASNSSLWDILGVTLPSSIYIVQLVQASSPATNGCQLPLQCIQTPQIPDGPQNLRVEFTKPGDTNFSSVTLSWKLPTGLDGKSVTFRGSIERPSHHKQTWNMTQSQADPSMYNYTVQNLESGYSHTASITLHVEEWNFTSKQSSISFLMPENVSALEKIKTWFSVQIPEEEIKSNQVTVIVKGDIPDSELNHPLYERLDRAVLLVSEVCKEDPKPLVEAFSKLNQNLPNTLSWSQARTMECIGQYQTSPDNWDTFQRKAFVIAQDKSLKNVQFVVGEYECNSEDYNWKCNGPLKPGTDYALIVRIILSTGFVDLDPINFRTKSDINVFIIGFAVPYTIFLISMIVLFVVRNHKRQLRESKKTDGVNEPVDISVAKFVDSYERLVASNEYAVADEYEMIEDFSERFANGKMKDAAEKGAKNRYLNVLPFDFNRVLLNVEEETERANDDYINASFIDGHKSQREYIATQGPMEETCYDFWRMVLQYEIESIVMLTQTVDHEKNKCSQYYPLANQSVQYGDIQVKCTEETNLALYNKRLLVVSKGNQSKVVTHYHYSDWPDHNCPASPADLMKFVMIVRSERKNKTIPLVVHCSAGVGRTGTFMALDIILQRIKCEKKINVYTTVKRLRSQRVQMVQTLEQYTFLYQCCLEYMNKPIKSSIINITEHGEAETNRQVLAATKRAFNRMKVPLETSFKTLMSKVQRKEQAEAQ